MQAPAHPTKSAPGHFLNFRLLYTTVHREQVDTTPTTGWAAGAVEASGGRFQCRRPWSAMLLVCPPEEAFLAISMGHDDRLGSSDRCHVHELQLDVLAAIKTMVRGEGWARFLALAPTHFLSAWAASESAHSESAKIRHCSKLTSQ